MAGSPPTCGARVEGEGDDRPRQARRLRRSSPALVSLMPGPQMVFVMTQAAWRGPRAGAAALAGLQLGNATWFVMAGLGLGTLALAWPARLHRC